MAIRKEILDELLKDKDPKTMFSSEGLLGELKKALAERVLNAEMDHHLADSTQDEVSEGDKPANHRNGYSKKTVLTENEALELSIPKILVFCSQKDVRLAFALLTSVEPYQLI